MENPFSELLHRLDRIEKKLEKASITPQKNDAEERFLSVREASEFLGLKSQTVYRKVHAEKIPYYKKNNRLYFSKSELIEYVKEGRLK